MAVQTTDISGWTATSGPTTVTPTTSATTGFSLQYPFLIQRSGPRKRKTKKKGQEKNRRKKKRKTRVETVDERIGERPERRGPKHEGRTAFV